jgi:hypothetical protein
MATSTVTNPYFQPTSATTTPTPTTFRSIVLGPGLASPPATATETAPTSQATFGSGLKCVGLVTLLLQFQEVNEQCVQVYDGFEAGTQGVSNSYKPNVCDDTCYPYYPGFGGIAAYGDGTFGTSCQAFSTSNCTDGTAIGGIGNQVESSSTTLAQKAFGIVCKFKC